MRRRPTRSIAWRSWRAVAVGDQTRAAPEPLAAAASYKPFQSIDHLLPIGEGIADSYPKEYPHDAGTDIQEVLASLKSAQQRPLGTLAKSTFKEATSPTSGLTFYDLELGAKFLYPVLTPLRNAIPRVSGKGGIQANWRAVTAINTQGLRFGVSSANRGGVLAVATQDYSAAYKGIGVETSVDFEAQYAGQGFDDIRAIAAKTGLESLMLGEEAMILGGNASLPLGTTPTPTLSDMGTGGSLAAGTALSVICVALTHDGMLNATVSGGIQGQITRTNADATSDTFGGGASVRSANATITTASDGNATHLVRASHHAGARRTWLCLVLGHGRHGTAWRAHVDCLGGDHRRLRRARRLPGRWERSTVPTNTLAFDGLLTQALVSGSGATVITQPQGIAGNGTPLTSDNSGGIVEIDAALKAMWDQHRLSPDTIWVSSQEALNVSRKIVTGAASSAMRFTYDVSDNFVGGGTMVRTYLNRFSMQGGSVVDLRVHPNMPAGTLLMTTNMLPYPLAGVGNLMQIRTRQDYYQIEWPLRTRRYEYGVYADEVLQHFFPPALARHHQHRQRLRSAP